MTNSYDLGLAKTAANYQPLTPITFLARSARVYPNHTAIIHGQQSLNYAQMYARCRKLASALERHGVKKGDTVSVMLANTPPMLECHYGVPMTGAVLNTMNTRLDAPIIAFTLAHAETKVLIVDREFSQLVQDALGLMEGPKPFVIDFDDRQFQQDGPMIGSVEYETFIADGDAEYDWKGPDDEWEAISLNYTSGTTGNPKGVVYHHRGAYLLAQGNAITTSMAKHPVYLWTLPMFHCNGWCFPWTMSVIGGTNVCLRQVRPNAIWQALADHGVTHLCGAPIVMSTILGAPEQDKRKLDHVVEFFTAAAPPPEATLAAMADAGFNVTHLYGLTESYGPAVVNDWSAAWDELPSAERAKKKARQGVPYAALDDLTIMDPETMTRVPPDGETMGEVMMRGNIIMKGYLKNQKASDEAFRGGWFHTGDLGVLHADGYIQLKDRSKDIIISGGENISSIEVEDTLYKHPDIAACAVVAKTDDKWGETPCAFIELKTGKTTTAEEIIEYCRANMARFKAPRHVIFTELPKTSTGKIQKFKLREMAEDV